LSRGANADRDGGRDGIRVRAVGERQSVICGGALLSVEANERGDAGDCRGGCVVDGATTRGQRGRDRCGVRRDQVGTESSTSTTGWITKGAPAAVVADGWVTMTSFAATAIGNVVVAEVSRLSEKVML